MILGDSPQQEQFQIKVFDMFKKLQKKCDLIGTEVKQLKSDIASIAKAKKESANSNSNQASVDAMIDQVVKGKESAKVVDLENPEDPVVAKADNKENNELTQK